MNDSPVMNPPEIHDLRSFLARVDLLPNESPQAVYRGEQADFDHPCTPGLFRGEITQNHFLNGYKNEKENVYQWFNRVTTIERTINIANSDIDRMILAQHYGLHTRLLDWSTNPLVALWFATTQSDNKNGYVYIYEPLEDLDSINNIFLLISNRNNYDDRYNALALNPFCLDIPARLRIDSDSPIAPFSETHFFRPTALFDQRVLNQSAVISIHPNPDISKAGNEQDSDIYPSVCIKAEAKKRIRQELEVLGISEATLGLWTRESIASQLNSYTSKKNRPPTDGSPA